MYVVREKATHTILFSDSSTAFSGLDGKAIYPDFDGRSMELGWTTAKKLPDYFKIKKSGELVELALKEQVNAGLLTLLPAEKIVNNQIVEKTLGEIVHDRLRGDTQQVREALRLVDRDIESDIHQRYRAGYELKLLKDYVAWLADDKPTGDAREARYLEMQADIEAITRRYQPLRAKVKKALAASQRSTPKAQTRAKAANKNKATTKTKGTIKRKPKKGST